MQLPSPRLARCTSCLPSGLLQRGVGTHSVLPTLPPKALRPGGIQRGSEAEQASPWPGSPCRTVRNKGRGPLPPACASVSSLFLTQCSGSPKTPGFRHPFCPHGQSGLMFLSRRANIWVPGLNPTGIRQVLPGVRWDSFPDGSYGGL